MEGHGKEMHGIKWQKKTKPDKPENGITVKQNKIEGKTKKRKDEKEEKKNCKRREEEM